MLKKDDVKQRNSAIELLRIIAMCGVVILHYNNASIGGGFYYVENPSLNRWVLYLAETLFVCVVDLYVIITGYFSCVSEKRNIVKIIGLIFQVSVFRVAIYLFGIVQGGTFSKGEFFTAILPINYFAILYAALYAASPYINVLLKNLSRVQQKKLLGLSIVLLSVWPTIVDVIEVKTGAKNGLSTISAFGSDWGYNLINFLFLYLIGALIKLWDIKVNRCWAVAVYFVCVIFLAVWGMVGSQDVAWSYCNPVVILQAVCFFFCFRNMTINSKLINELSKASFTCFLFHTFVLGHYGIQKAVQGNVIYMIGHMFFTAVSIYVLSYIVFKIWDYISKPFMKIITVIIAKVKIDISLD